MSWTPASSSHSSAVTSNGDAKNTSQIDGIGLWKSFTRNFASPLLAAFDLLDNAFDAAAPQFGHLHIDADRDDNRTRGIVILNDCKLPVKNLSDVLTVYKSSKGKAAEAIGENGVGIKQGCATLSDLSFVLSRNDNEYSLGIIAFDLQTPAGIYLPSFTFTRQHHHRDDDDDEALDIETELRKICCENPDVGRVIEKYGEGEIEVGIKLLVGHYIRMSSGMWGNSRYIFGLVIHNLKHGSLPTNNSDVEVTTESLQNRRKRLQAAHRVNTFLKQIEEELPKHYLHVAHSFDVQINGRRVSFSYWQRRLVELTHFQVLMDKERPISSENLAVDQSEMVPGKGQYILDIYVGFDAMRCADKQASKQANLVWHSRLSGRLIKHNNDARGELRLTSGGTNYCQGLTIIVDDRNGALPLNPTKQDFAFGECTHGATHHENLITWVGAASRAYYNYHLEQSHGRKAILTERVSRVKALAQKYATDDLEAEAKIKSISECNFTVFHNRQYTYFSKAKSISIRKNFKVIQGKDTIMQLPPAPAPASAVAPSHNLIQAQLGESPAASSPAIQMTSGASKVTPQKTPAMPVVTPQKTPAMPVASTKKRSFEAVDQNDEVCCDFSPLSTRQRRELGRQQGSSEQPSHEELNRVKQKAEEQFKRAQELRVRMRRYRRERDELAQEKEGLQAQCEKGEKARENKMLREQLAKLQKERTFYKSRSERLAQENDELLKLMNERQTSSYGARTEDV